MFTQKSKNCFVVEKTQKNTTSTYIQYESWNVLICVGFIEKEKRVERGKKTCVISNILCININQPILQRTEKTKRAATLVRSRRLDQAGRHAVEELMSRLYLSAPQTPASLSQCFMSTLHHITHNAIFLFPIPIYQQNCATFGWDFNQK